MSEKQAGSLIRKMKSWLSLESDTKLEHFYFGSDKAGRLLFYPWGRPGESYYANQEQRKKFTKHNTLIVLIMLLVAAFFILLEIFASTSTALILSANVYYLVKFVYAYFFTKNLRFYEQVSSDGSEMVGVPVLVKNSFYAALIQMFFIVLGLLFNPYNYTLWGCGVFIVLFYPIIIAFFWFRKGYLFQKRPSLV